MKFKAGMWSFLVPLILLFPGTSLKAATYVFEVDTGGTLLSHLEYYAREEADSNDVSVNARSAAVVGSPTWRSGKVNNGMALTPSSGVQLNGLPTWTDVNKWSFGYWYNVSSLPQSGQDYLSVQQDGRGQFGASFRQEPTGTLKYLLINRGNATLAECDGITVLTPGTWYYVVVTYAGTGRVFAAYVNDSQDCTVTENGSAALSNGNIGLNLEVDNSQTSLAFDIDEMGIWSKVLSSRERTDLYNRGRGQTVVMRGGGTSTPSLPQRTIVATPSAPAASPAPSQHPPGAAEGAAGCAACGTCGAVSTGVLIGVPLLYIALNIALLVWVARDAKARGMDSSVMWMLLVMFTSVVGLAIYLFSRPKGNVIRCASCGNNRLQASASCPHCGNA